MRRGLAAAEAIIAGMRRVRARRSRVTASCASCSRARTWRAASNASPRTRRFPAAVRRYLDGCSVFRRCSLPRRMPACAGRNWRARLGRRRPEHRGAADAGQRPDRHHRRILRHRRDRNDGPSRRRPCAEARRCCPIPTSRWCPASRIVDGMEDAFALDTARAGVAAAGGEPDFRALRAPAISSRRSCSAHTARSGSTSSSSTAKASSVASLADPGDQGMSTRGDGQSFKRSSQLSRAAPAPTGNTNLKESQPC